LNTSINEIIGLNIFLYLQWQVQLTNLIRSRNCLYLKFFSCDDFIHRGDFAEFLTLNPNFLTLYLRNNSHNVELDAGRQDAGNEKCYTDEDLWRVHEA